MTKTNSEELRAETRRTTIDKTSWPRGPWDDEPDLLEWRSQHPPHYHCQIARSDLFGQLCGYVAIHRRHPLHGLHYRDERLRRIDLEWELTYSAPADQGHWAIGFACNRRFDLLPALDAAVKQGETVLPNHLKRAHSRLMQEMQRSGAEYRTVEVVRAEVEKLALQLAAMADGSTVDPR